MTTIGDRSRALRIAFFGTVGTLTIAVRAALCTAAASIRAASAASAATATAATATTTAAGITLLLALVGGRRVTAGSRSRLFGAGAGAASTGALRTRPRRFAACALAART